MFFNSLAEHFLCYYHHVFPLVTLFLEEQRPTRSIRIQFGGGENLYVNLTGRAFTKYQKLNDEIEKRIGRERRIGGREGHVLVQANLSRDTSSLLSFSVYPPRKSLTSFPYTTNLTREAFKKTKFKKLLMNGVLIGDAIIILKYRSFNHLKISF